MAASAAEIKTVLLKDPGLMVELKRWVAKDATDHGQIVADSDLMDDAIFDRLESDVPFRSIATALVQRYGYLLPRLNPDSDLGKQRQLLIEERTKWLAQDEEQQRLKERQRASQGLQTTGACESLRDDDCSAPMRRSAPETIRDQQNEPGPDGIPRAPAFPNSPQEQAPPDRERAAQTAEQFAENLGLPPLGDSREPQLPFNMRSAEFADSTVQAANFGSNDRAAGILSAMSPDLSGRDGYDPDNRSSDRGASVPTAARVNERESASTRGGGGSGQPFSERYVANHFRTAPELAHKPGPYDDIPSLYDMYLQAVPRPAQPRRFGLEVFQNGIRDSRLIAMDLPVSPDYVLGPGDGLAIDLWGGVSRRLYRTVDNEGRVSLPEVGPVLVSGKSLADVQQNLQQVLRGQFRDVSADVSLSRLRTVRVFEVGDIERPGAYDVSSLSTPLNALFSAGGPTARGSVRLVKHFRGNQLVEVVDMYDLLLHGVKGNLARLESGDTVLVPPLGSQVTIEGMVRRPAIYELRDEKTLSSVLELAGGLLPTAALCHIEVQRTVAHERKTMMSFDIPERDAGNTAEVEARLESFAIQDGDSIRVFPIAPYNQDVIFLEGHVIRPGRYSYRKDMRVTDIVASYKDLLPEPAAQYAEIVRLNPPDFHPSLESFDLANALENPAQAPSLQPMDTIRVFSRFDFENPPAVSVWGDVRAPGTYRTSGSIRLADAVHLAGGLAPDAQTADAQVFRYLPDGKMKIFSVRLSAALAGDPTANILMEARDRLLIHRNPDAVEPATAYIEGEVGKPGRYPLTTNMTVADLIKVGGGLKPSADSETADLTRYRYNGVTLTGEHEAISISGALAGEAKANAAVHNGDVLTVRQLSGWSDLGATIAVKGEVKHPGSYGIRPGERLSSVLQRADGFQPGAYPYGAILERTQVRELESKQRVEMILRVKDLQSNLEALPETDPRRKQVKEAALEQYQTTLTQLSSNPPVGRVAIRISSNIGHWRNTADDIEVRAGDTLIVPKTPSYVMVTGQVFNPTAVSYRPGKSAKWYLGQSGGPTALANKKAIFVIRADGSVIGAKEGVWSGNSLGAVLRPGDTVVVPEKAIGPGKDWQNIFASAQVASSIASTVFIALRY